jgi:hypothetical protein
MNIEDAARLTRRLGTLRTWTEDATAEMMSALVKMDDLDAAEIAVDGIVEGWTESFRPTVAFVRTEYQVQHAANLSRRSMGRGPQAAPGCDGSRMVSVPGPDPKLTYSAPCPRCNPVLYDLWKNDPIGYTAWLKMMPTLTLRPEAAIDIPPCAVETWHDDAIPPNRGYDFAMRAYVEDCKELGIPVDVDKIHRVIKGLLGKDAPMYSEPVSKGPGTPSSRSGVRGSAAASPAASDAPDTADRKPGT